MLTKKLSYAFLSIILITQGAHTLAMFKVLSSVYRIKLPQNNYCTKTKGIEILTKKNKVLEGNFISTNSTEVWTISLAGLGIFGVSFCVYQSNKERGKYIDEYISYSKSLERGINEFRGCNNYIINNKKIK